MSHSPEAVRKQVKVYLAVFIALAALTIVTVGVSYLHLPLVWAVGVALAVATVKGTLVALYFMHLSAERRIIYSILLLTVFFFLFLLIAPAITAHV